MDESQLTAEVLANEVRAVVGTILRRLRQEVLAGGLSWSQMLLVARIDKSGGVTSAELARAEGVRPQSISSTVEALEAEGFIQRSPDPKDGRRVLLTLTEAGRKARATSLAIQEHWLVSAFSALTAEEQRDLQRGLELLKRISQK